MLQENLLKVSKIHSIYYSTYGNKTGIPLLIIHGGPGGYSKFKKITGIDLEKFYVILYDQRGCGKSTPNGELLENTTQYAIKDIEKILTILNITKVVISASSWGTTLALLFSIVHPERILKMFLSSTFLGRKFDNDWLFSGSKIIFPDLYEKFMKMIPENESPAKYLLGKIKNSNFEEKQKIVSNIANYEKALCSMVFSKVDFLDYSKVQQEHINSMSIFLHYEANNFFIKENYILNNLNPIKHVPIVFYHGRFDMECLIDGVYQLHKKLPNSKLIIIPYENHGGIMTKELINNEINNYIN